MTATSARSIYTEYFCIYGKYNSEQHQRPAQSVYTYKTKKRLISSLCAHKMRNSSIPDLDRVPENGSDCDSGGDDNSMCSSNLGFSKVIKKKSKKKGIIFLSTIPPYMNVTKIREIFGEFGDVGRIYLQPSGKPGEKRKRIPNQFTEGWVEFQKKKVAKQVAAKLNNTKIGTRKKSRYYDMLWNIKYIPRFKWIHLSERLAYEKAAMKQRLRAEISQAKKEAHYLQSNVEKSKRLKRNKAINSGQD